MTSFHQELLAAVSEANSAEEGEAEPLPLAALCLLSRAPRVPGAVATERLQRSVALTALLGHAYCFSLQDTRRKRRMLAHYAYLATQVPVFALRIESGPDVLPEVLQRLDEWMRAAFVR